MRSRDWRTRGADRLETELRPIGEIVADLIAGMNDSPQLPYDQGDLNGPLG